jgi:exopolyphosphatase / guanosine-5'-triphosphate,3'-diphosphate pyrophosphatase
VLCLRLAVIKCHSRQPPSTTALGLRARGREAQLVYTPAWADSRPRTVFLLRQEAEVWARSGPLRLILP